MDDTDLERGLLDALFGDWPVGMAILDRERRFVRANHALGVITRTPIEDLVGRTIPEVVPALADRIEPWLLEVERERSAPVGLRLQGRERTWQLSIVPIVHDDDVTGFAVYVLDVTTEAAVTEALEHQTAVIYDEIVQSLAAASFARDLGREDLMDEHLAKALDVARRLATESVHRLLKLAEAS